MPLTRVMDAERFGLMAWTAHEPRYRARGPWLGELLAPLRIFCLLFACVQPANASSAGETAQSVVARALEAQGGEATLRQISGVRLRAIIARNAIEQSVRPEGPWAVNFSDVVMTRRFEPASLLTESSSRGYASSWWSNSEWKKKKAFVTAGAAFDVVAGRITLSAQGPADLAEESLALGPERVLITAKSADDLTLAPKTVFHGAKHDVLKFSWRGAAVRVFLSSGSGMPSGVEIVRPRPLEVFWSSWGDVANLVEWENWTIEPQGVRYPRLWKVSSNGQEESTTMIDGVEFNPPTGPPEPVVNADLVRRAKQSRRPISAIPFAAKGTEIVPGITLYQGAWNVLKVISPSGTYVVEAPISNEYSSGAIAAAGSNGKRLSGLITTSDSWPHIGGLRQYVARSIPIIALDLNKTVISRLLKAPHRQAPDALARIRIAPKIRYVSQNTSLGSGLNRMTLIPLRTPTGERQMVIYWPAHRLLYTSDLMTVQANGLYLPQYRDELKNVIQREGLDVKDVFGMHYPLTAWSKVLIMEHPKT